MTSTHWNEVRRTLERIIDAPQHLRDALLRETDTRIREEVESLLRHETAPDALRTGLGLNEPAPAWPTLDSAVGMKIGNFRLEALIAEGGMGAVYRAHRDGEFDQAVAIKLLKPGIVGSATMRRFHAERQTLARLEHPFITRLYDGGISQSGIPYLVMELVRGEPIDTYCRKSQPSVEALLRLFVQICDAVEHAHRALIVHRDLKPGNILVTADATPRLIDFGIAKLIDFSDDEHDLPTVTAQRPMTPRYASPEQQNGALVTTVSDVYSLGMILGELLEIVGDNGSRRLPDDLATIVKKASHPEVDRRYGSVREFADDIERFLGGRPIKARRDTLRYRTFKFAARNRFACAAGALALITLLVGAVGVTLALRQARHDQRIAVSARNDAEQITQFMQRIYAAANPYRHSRNVTLLELLEDAARRVEYELTDQPRVEAGVRLAIGQTYAGLWLWEEARPHLERALELYRQHTPNDREKIAQCLTCLGRAVTFARDESSIAIQEEALRIRRALHGDHHPTVAECLGNLAFAHWHGTANPEHRHWDTADKLYSEAIAILRAYGDDLNLAQRRDLARLTFSHAVMKEHIDENDAALKLFEDATAIYDDIGGSADRYMVACVERHGWLLEKLGKYADAEAHLDRALALTPTDLRTDTSLINLWRLARLRALQNDHEGAEARCRTAMDESAALIVAENPEQADAVERILSDFHEANLSQLETRRAISRLRKLDLERQYSFDNWRSIAMGALPRTPVANAFEADVLTRR